MITHLACIMDGNRRWAQERGMLPWLGNKMGVEGAKRAILYCLKREIPYLSLYTFSIENLQRGSKEKEFMFSQLPKLMVNFGDELARAGVRARFIGDKKLFPESIQLFIHDVESKTKDCSKLFLQLLFCYGSHQEIVAAVQDIAQDAIEKKILPKSVTKEVFEKYMWTKGVPFPDLIIRTGKQKRLSNFLLFQAAYAELYFLDIFWPEITEIDFERICAEFENTKRNFGK